MPPPSNAYPFAPTAPVTDARRTSVIFAVCLVLALWLLARPYVGLRHDGALYLGQVLLHWRPDVMSHDLFFQFGSQDKYTIVSRLLAQLYRHADMAQAQIVLIALSQLATLWLTLLLLRRAGLDATGCVLGVAAVCVMSHNYGGFSIFSFSERFVTGRIFAEPLALAGLLAVHRRKVVPGLAALAAAILFHPLVAVPALTMAWGMLVVRDRRWLWGLLAVPIALALAAAGVAPFSALLQSFDPDWWQAVQKFNGQVYVLHWPRDDWVALVFDCLVVWIAARVFPSLGLLFRTAAVATLALVAVSAIGCDLLQNVLVTQLQLWRAHWITHLLSLALLPALLLRIWRRDDLRARIVVMAVMALVVSTNVRYGNGIALAAWAAFALWLFRTNRPVDPRLMKLAYAATAVALLGTSVLVLLTAGGQLLQARGSRLDLAYLLLLAVTMPVLSLPLALGLLRMQQRGGALGAGALALVVAGVLFGALHWDQRSPWTRYIESHLDQEHPFEKVIGPTQQVLWWDQPTTVWAVLHRASYYSSQQAAGLLFNRDTAIEHWRRGGVIGAIQLQKDACEVMALLGIKEKDGEPCWPTLPALEQACAADRGPDFLVLDRRLERGFVSQWTFAPSPDSRTTYYLHDCKQIR